MEDVDNTETINILSLCTGYGGLELGLSRALEGVFRVVAVEIEAYALANLAAKAQENKLAIEAMWPDLKTFPAERFRGCFDFVLAGYPCQPFSVAGKRQGEKDERHLWPDIARIIKAVRPVWCFFENVPGHLSIGFPEVYRSLRNMGYTVEAGLFTAAECGAPHRRQRLFILAQSERSYDRRTSRQISGENEQQKEKRQKGRFAESCSSGELADTERAGSGQRTVEETQAGLGRDRLAEQRAVVADAGSTRTKIRLSKQTKWQGAEKPYNDCYRWPARPGQPQYEWEEPRVVVENPGKRRRLQQKKSENGSQNRRTINTSRQGQAQPRLGRAVDGTRSRMDRLRLLGNGVVPQQAEKAFRELYNLFI